MKKKDERSLLRPRLKNQSCLLYLENPNNQNLPLALQSISLDLPQTEIAKLCKITFVTETLNA